MLRVYFADDWSMSIFIVTLKSQLKLALLSGISVYILIFIFKIINQRYSKSGSKLTKMSTSVELETWVIRCQGLPRRVEGLRFAYEEEEIVKFFFRCNFKNGFESIHYSTDRRDEIYIEMASRNDLQKALKMDRKIFSSPQRQFHGRIRGD